MVWQSRTLNKSREWRVENLHCDPKRKWWRAGKRRMIGTGLQVRNIISEKTKKKSDRWEETTRLQRWDMQAPGVVLSSFCIHSKEMWKHFSIYKNRNHIYISIFRKASWMYYWDLITRRSFSEVFCHCMCSCQIVSIIHWARYILRAMQMSLFSILYFLVGVQ